jgi:hypothetical protein
VFNDGAVLQAELPVNVWGRAEPGATVTVAFAGQEKAAACDQEGRWKVQLDALYPSTELRTLSAASAGAPDDRAEADSAPGEALVYKTSDGQPQRLVLGIIIAMLMQNRGTSALTSLPKAWTIVPWCPAHPGVVFPSRGIHPTIAAGRTPQHSLPRHLNSSAC